MLTPGERYARAFENYLRQERALAPSTINNYLRFVRGFLTDCFGRGPVMLSRLSARDVMDFVQRQAAGLHPKRAKLLTTALRSFLRYARYRGAIRLDLAAAVPIVANWSMSSIPRAIGADQIRQLLASFDRRTATGRRDYAIVLLLARLGLRSGEVAFLELDDFDWDAGLVRIRGKGGHRTALPYLRMSARQSRPTFAMAVPPAPVVRVFLRSKAPIRGFLTQVAIGSIIRHALQRAGIEAPTTGAHQFRHALATQMLRHGASLLEIGEILRHRSPQTTSTHRGVTHPRRVHGYSLVSSGRRQECQPGVDRVL